MYKYLLGILLALSTLAARADTPLSINMATGDWNVSTSNEDFFWYPDSGHDFQAKIYYHALSGNTRTYSNYITKNYGDSDFQLNDAFNTYTTPDSQWRWTHWFVLMRYHYSSCTYNDALADYPDGWPQRGMFFNMWRPAPTSEWSGGGLWIHENQYWTLWLVSYNAYYQMMSISELDYGSTYTYPTDVSAWWQYGN